MQCREITTEIILYFFKEYIAICRYQLWLLDYGKNHDHYFGQYRDHYYLRPLLNDSGNIIHFFNFKLLNKKLSIETVWALIN